MCVYLVVAWMVARPDSHPAKIERGRRKTQQTSTQLLVMHRARTNSQRFDMCCVSLPDTLFLAWRVSVVLTGLHVRVMMCHNYGTFQLGVRVDGDTDPKDESPAQLHQESGSLYVTEASPVSR